MEFQFSKFQQERLIVLPGQLFQETGNGDTWGQIYVYLNI